MTRRRSEEDIPLVFMSHAASDAPVIEAIKNRLEEVTDGRLKFFLASDKRSIPAGVKWAEHIESNLALAKCMLLFLTHTSAASAYVLFEAGYAHARGTPVVPIGMLGYDIEHAP